MGRVTGRAGLGPGAGVDQLTVHTSNGRVLGPFGGTGGVAFDTGDWSRWNKIQQYPRVAAALGSYQGGRTRGLTPSSFTGAAQEAPNSFQIWTSMRTREEETHLNKSPDFSR